MIGIVGDAHFGARNGSPEYHEYFSEFWKDFFAWVQKNKVKKVIFEGDTFDVRKHVNTWTLDFFKKVVVQQVLDLDLEVFVIVGNHDIYYKESLKINTPDLVLSEYGKNFKVISEPTEVTLEGYRWLLVPWVTKENSSAVAEAVKASEADYCVGHFEFDGFPMHPGSLAKTHMNHSTYKKFKLVLSGHYHTQSRKDNVLYTGTPYEITWIDCGDPKGFFKFDDGEFEFIQNTHTIHRKISYPEKPSDLRSKYVQAYVEDLSDRKAIEAWKQWVIEQGCHDVKFSERSTVSYASEMNLENVKTNEELIFSYIDHLDTGLDKTRLKNKMSELYQQSMQDAET